MLRKFYFDIIRK